MSASSGSAAGMTKRRTNFPWSAAARAGVLSANTFEAPLNSAASRWRRMRSKSWVVLSRVSGRASPAVVQAGAGAWVELCGGRGSTAAKLGEDLQVQEPNSWHKRRLFASRVSAATGIAMDAPTRV